LRRARVERQGCRGALSPKNSAKRDHVRRLRNPATTARPQKPVAAMSGVGASGRAARRSRPAGPLGDDRDGPVAVRLRADHLVFRFAGRNGLLEAPQSIVALVKRVVVSFISILFLSRDFGGFSRRAASARVGASPFTIRARGATLQG
jgi:hypothetical protein